MTAGVQLLTSPDPSLGFLARARVATHPVEAWNYRLDAAVAAAFLLLVGTVVLSAARQVAGVIAGRIPEERELPPGGGPGRPVFGEVPPVGGTTRCC
jgi:hypothetical protein